METFKIYYLSSFQILSVVIMLGLDPPTYLSYNWTFYLLARLYCPEQSKVHSVKINKEIPH